MAGRRIDDHGSFCGKGGKYPLPEGNKMKSFKSAEGSGAEHMYPDTSEEIHSDQMKGDREAKKQKMKTGYRY
jgi:hypothetical protein